VPFEGRVAGSAPTLSLKGIIKGEEVHARTNIRSGTVVRFEDYTPDSYDADLEYLAYKGPGFNFPAYSRALITAPSICHAPCDFNGCCNEFTFQFGVELSADMRPQASTTADAYGIRASSRIACRVLNRHSFMRCLMPPLGHRITCLSKDSSAPAWIPHWGHHIMLRFVGDLGRELIYSFKLSSLPLPPTLVDQEVCQLAG